MGITTKTVTPHDPRGSTAQQQIIIDYKNKEIKQADLHR